MIWYGNAKASPPKVLDVATQARESARRGELELSKLEPGEVSTTLTRRKWSNADAADMCGRTLLATDLPRARVTTRWRQDG